ncbi:ATP-binding protein [Streptomyces durmitorensis]|uniref:ATP-binding protein n=1 Tax=Streptomyces durmitorensis TaxID=319947 RepID=A0ABY4PUF3_9ACTN|nr:ATP-binding protein [Streptomyces durmitorensis]UQT56697.1 ATP-binding protein [Streptomyces durmitorensis]
MKQSAAKTLGVAALGAAFAAAGAGAANAAPAVPDATGALGAATSTLPTAQVADTLPAGGPEAVAAGQNALGSTLQAAAPTVDKLGESTKDAADRGKPAADPLSGLLGGLPVAGALPLQGGLPTQGLPVEGLPLG